MNSKLGFFSLCFVLFVGLAEKPLAHVILSFLSCLVLSFFFAKK